MSSGLNGNETQGGKGARQLFILSIVGGGHRNGVRNSEKWVLPSAFWAADILVRAEAAD